MRSSPPAPLSERTAASSGIARPIPTAPQAARRNIGKRAKSRPAAPLRPLRPLPQTEIRFGNDCRTPLRCSMCDERRRRQDDDTGNNTYPKRTGPPDDSRPCPDSRRTHALRRCTAGKSSRSLPPLAKRQRYRKRLPLRRYFSRNSFETTMRIARWRIENSSGDSPSSSPSTSTDTSGEDSIRTRLPRSCNTWRMR